MKLSLVNVSISIVIGTAMFTTGVATGVLHIPNGIAQIEARLTALELRDYINSVDALLKKWRGQGYLDGGDKTELCIKAKIIEWDVPKEIGCRA